MEPDTKSGKNHHSSSTRDRASVWGLDSGLDYVLVFLVW